MGEEVVVVEESKSKCMPFFRVVNIITGCVLIGFGIAGIIFMAVKQLLSGMFFLVFSPIFMILFGIIIVAAECQIIFILKHIGFLQSLFGRGVFNIYLASSVFYFFACGSNDEVVGWIFGIILFVMGVVYIIMHFCGGSEYNREIREKIQA